MSPSFKIISIIGDSLPMVRPPVSVSYPQTYPCLLQEKLGPEFHVITRYRRANNSKIQGERQNMEDDFLYNDSKYIVFHLGVADCVPRLITPKERFLLKVLNIKALTDFYIKFKSKHRRFFTKTFSWTSVPKGQFKENLNQLISEIKTAHAAEKVIFVNIAQTNDVNDFRCYRFKENIKAYNDVISEVVGASGGFCSLIDFYSATKENGNLILEDGSHLSSDGHKFLADRLKAAIMNFENR